MKTDLSVCGVVVFGGNFGQWEGFFFPSALVVAWLGGLCVLVLIRGYAFLSVEEVRGYKQGTIGAFCRILSACVRYIAETIEISLVLLFFVMHF